MGRPVTGFAYLDDVAPPAVIAMAHRGGARHPDLDGLENTAAAFRHAVGLGYTYLETDVHVTASGELVAFHDDVLDRVTDQQGRVASVAAGVLARARIGGEHPVPRLADLLEEFPTSRFNIDLKADGAGPVLVDLVERTRSHDRICVGSFSHARLSEFRRLVGGRVPTSASPVEVAAFLALPSGAAARLLTRSRVAALQVPHRRGPVPLVTASLVRRAHAAGAHVHVWTVDEPAQMETLIDLGVDGLITDRTDRLKELLVSRGLWADRA
ncbi:MAG: glycerophosphodiester phosphodiesterase [Propionibacteriales bacterium]|nr:glycerophosphodiester phosphodiesterase [Propionibacteriales bacterium]